MRLNIVAIGLAALAGFGTQAHAQYDESRIRTTESSTVVRAYGGWAFFTITGYANDWVESPFYNGPLGSAPWVYMERNSGGQVSYRFTVQIQPWMGGGTIALYRRNPQGGYDRIDEDRLLWG